jgi:5-methylcytosine-specific restriction endonuclease McrA
MVMRLCGGAGCQTAIPENVRYCPACTEERTPKQSDDGIRSNSVSDRERYAFLYKGERWKRNVQPKALKACPMCSRCGIKVSELVDHIVPAGEVIRQAQESGLYPGRPYAGFFFSTNLTGLCRGCHWHKTNEDKMHVGPWPDAVALEQSKPRKVYSF